MLAACTPLLHHLMHVPDRPSGDRRAADRTPRDDSFLHPERPPSTDHFQTYTGRRSADIASSTIPVALRLLLPTRNHIHPSLAPDIHRLTLRRRTCRQGSVRRYPRISRGQHGSDPAHRRRASPQQTGARLARGVGARPSPAPGSALSAFTRWSLRASATRFVRRPSHPSDLGGEPIPDAVTGVWSRQNRNAGTV